MRCFACENGRVPYQLSGKVSRVSLINKNTFRIFYGKMKSFINLILILSFFTQTIDTNESVLVHTQYGDVLGYETDLARIFYGIPFAQPPIGNLR